MRKLTNGKYFERMKYEKGEWWENWVNGKWYIITSVEAGKAVDEYGSVDSGWLHTMCEATVEELAERERQKAERAALSPEERIDGWLSLFPEN